MYGLLLLSYVWSTTCWANRTFFFNPFRHSAWSGGPWRQNWACQRRPAYGLSCDSVSPVHLLALALRSASIASAFPTNSSVENSSRHININHSIFPSPWNQNCCKNCIMITSPKVLYSYHRFRSIAVRDCYNAWLQKGSRNTYVCATEHSRAER